MTITPFRAIATELNLLLENVQVWPRAHIQVKLDKIRRRLLKAITQAKKTKALLLLLALSAGCEKKEDGGGHQLIPAAYACNHVMTNFNGALTVTSPQNITVNVNQTQYPHDSVQVYLCKAGLNCDTLGVVDWSIKGEVVSIYEGEKIKQHLGFDTYSIVAVQCR